jgi:hypothetical protein
MVKKTWRNRLTAFISTARRYNHASPDIVIYALVGGPGMACCESTVGPRRDKRDEGLLIDEEAVSAARSVQSRVCGRTGQNMG